MNSESMLAKYETDTGQEITIDAQTVRDICGNGNANITDREVFTFIELCKAHRLNPFIKEAYLVKYGSNPATIITGKDVFIKRAARNEKCCGFKAGVAVRTPEGGYLEREGSMVLPGESILGGWSEVYMEGKQPYRSTVSFAEYNAPDKYGKNGWSKMPGTMIRKVALVNALRDAMPEDFNGLYGVEEMAQANQPRGVQPEPEAAEVVYEVEQHEASAPRAAQGQAVTTEEDKARAIDTVAAIAETVKLPSGSEEREERLESFRSVCREAKAAGIDLMAFRSEMQGTHGREFEQFTADQIKSSEDELVRRIGKAKKGGYRG